MIENFLSVQDSIFIVGIIGILIKIIQLKNKW